MHQPPPPSYQSDIYNHQQLQSSSSSSSESTPNTFIPDEKLKRLQSLERNRLAGIISPLTCLFLFLTKMNHASL